MYRGIPPPPDNYAQQLCAVKTALRFFRRVSSLYVTLCPGSSQGRKGRGAQGFLGLRPPQEPLRAPALAPLRRAWVRGWPTNTTDTWKWFLIPGIRSIELKNFRSRGACVRHIILKIMHCCINSTPTVTKNFALFMNMQPAKNIRNGNAPQIQSVLLATPRKLFPNWTKVF